MTAVPAHMLRFIDNCSWCKTRGNNPSKFIDPVNDTNISAQVCLL